MESLKQRESDAFIALLYQAIPYKAAYLLRSTGAKSAVALILNDLREEPALHCVYCMKLW